MKSETKKFYVTFTATLDGETKEMPVGKPFNRFDTAVAFADAAVEAWNRVSNTFKYSTYTVSFKE